MAQANTPYFKTPITQYYRDILIVPKLTQNADDTYYTVEKKFEHRPDLLSYHFYETPNYWYVFMMRNMDQMEDPIFDLTAGMEIRIPTVNHVKGIN